MAEEIDLKELEKNAYKTTLQDGLIDIEIGILFVGMGINAFFSDFVPRLVNILGFIIVGIIAVMPIIIGKKYIVQPRVGLIKFGPKRKAKKKKILVFSLINTIILVIMVILTLNSVLQQIPLRGAALLLVLGLVFATLPLSIMAYLLQFPRLFVYGLLIGFGLSLAEILEFFFTILLIGIVILSIGIVYFTKFLRRYPIPEKEVS
jgi:hypothetical protein